MLRKSIITLLLGLIFSVSTQAEFKNESEVSMVVTGGNTEVEVYNGKTTNKYIFEKNTFTLGGHYMYGTTTNVLSSRNWDVNGKYERLLSKRMGAFVGVVYEGDEFAGIDSRINTDLGGSFHYLRTDKLDGILEMGARHRREKSLLGKTLDQMQGRAYAAITRKKTEDVELKFWVEYLPNFTTPSDWQINFAPSFQYNLNSLLALKWTYLGKYDNLPVPGNKNFDFQYTTSLIANF